MCSRISLQRLPVDRFPFFHEGEQTVHRDGYVEVAKAYYSVPPEYRGRSVVHAVSSQAGQS